MSLFLVVPLVAVGRDREVGNHPDVVRKPTGGACFFVWSQSELPGEAVSSVPAEPDASGETRRAPNRP